MPTERSVRVLAACVAAAAAAAVTAAADLARRPDAAGARAFHAVTGGLGTGPALHLDGCAAAFDARLEDDCADDADAVPAGRALCPVRATPGAGR